jgi:hypothetical protein
MLFEERRLRFGAEEYKPLDFQLGYRMLQQVRQPFVKAVRPGRHAPLVIVPVGPHALPVKARVRVWIVLS